MTSIHAAPKQIAHNQPARSAYLIHEGDHDHNAVSVFQPDREDPITVVELPHDVNRFAHFGTLTALHGHYGASILSGTDVLFTNTAPGPYAFLNGKFRIDPYRTDVRGIEITDTHLGTLELEPHWGDVYAAAKYRGMTLGFFDGGTIFSAVGAVTTEMDPSLRPQVYGEIYIHPQVKLLSIAHPTGWIYSTNDSRTWQHIDRGGWPIKFGDREIYVLRDLKLEKQPC